jgi:hypothetical protein
MVTFTVTAYREDVFIHKHSHRKVRSRVSDTTALPGISYNIYESDRGVHTGGITRSFSVSDAENIGAFYRIPKGTSNNITLVVLYQNKGVEADEYRMSLASIGYTLKESTNTIVTLESNVHTLRSSEVTLEE